LDLRVLELMAAISKVLRTAEGGQLVFWCPGCDEAHAITVGRWTWDGNAERPTFAPSILIRSGHYSAHFKPNSDVCWCTYNREHPEDAASFTCSVCHSFVVGGRIQFLTDSTHRLAGQTVDLPEWTEVD
jgi:hypothetical protein